MARLDERRERTLACFRTLIKFVLVHRIERVFFFIRLIRKRIQKHQIEIYLLHQNVIS